MNVADETYGDHCGSLDAHDPHHWDDNKGNKWHCMGTFWSSEDNDSGVFGWESDGGSCG